MVERIKIDALRGIAAGTVLLAHADAYDLVKSAWLTANKVFLGHFGVALFFVLSGALIWRSAQPLLANGRLGTYALHRATRILPIYWACIAFVVFVMPMIGSYFVFHVTPETLWRHLTFTQSFGVDVSRSINPVLWTLSWEVAFYIAVPVLFVLARWVNPVWWLLVLVPFTSWAPYLPLFGVGIMLEEIRAGRWRGRDIAVTLVGVAGFLAISDPNWMPALAAAMLTGVVYLARIPKWARYPLAPVAFVGLISYSLYVWHYLLLEIAGWKLDDIRSLMGPVFREDLWRALIVVGVILVMSTLSYLIIERPFMGPIRRWLETPRAKLATV